ncbi:YARHG domain-containing protein, partial [Candidatus Collinsella stercoripullorum]|uniref:YARHG domain-containing protein n=1 Tax=Candidatus Collinsella stercoripullorum TaxID=2838522 RepID=UPI0022E10DFF
MTADELELARNEIYARYGRGFSTDYLQKYFDSQAWYTRLYSPEEFDAMTSPLNSVEQQNVANMLRVEKDLRY